MKHGAPRFVEDRMAWVVKGEAMKERCDPLKGGTHLVVDCYRKLCLKCSRKGTDPKCKTSAT